MNCPFVMLSQLLILVFIWSNFVEGHSEYLPALFHKLSKVGGKIQSRVKNYNKESDFFTNPKQITHGGTNAEAYWSFDDTKFSFQGIRYPLNETHPCDQIYTMNADGSNIKLESVGGGRDTCSYYLEDGKTIIYSSTSSATKYCPPIPDMTFYGYVWPIYKEMTVYKKDTTTGKNQRLTKWDGYTAESTISPDGKTVVFTSDKDGDLELYTMSVDGTNVRRITYTPGYDGGAFFSNDGTKLVWRANRPVGADLQNYFTLLKFGMVVPIGMQLYVSNADGTNAIPITNNNATNFAPYFLPDDSGIIFTSDLFAPNSGGFHLYRINLDGTGLQQITTEGNFNCFPMFSHDGKYLAWESDRGTKIPGEINVFTATWVGH